MAAARKLKLVHSAKRTSSSRNTSVFLPDLFTRRSDFSQRDMTYLEKLLPVGWHNFFETRKYGKYLGCRIVCKKCGATPESDCHYGSQRWRWMAAHIISKHVEV